MGRDELDEVRRFLNKWEMHKALQGEDLGPCRLPDTVLFSRESLADLLSRYGSVYVKPVDTWGGRGISRVESDGGEWVWMMQGEAPKRSETVESLVEAVGPFYEKGRCIVQQTAPLMSYQGSVFDIRVHMQRNLDGTWDYSGELARVSGADSIVSNVIISGGSVHPVEAVLGESFEKRQLVEIGHAVCRALNDYPIFYEIGLDLGVDPDGGLWLIEVNTNDAISGPSHELFNKLPDKTYAKGIRERWQARQFSILQLLMEMMVEAEEEGEKGGC